MQTRTAGILAAGAAMVAVGSSVTVSHSLVDYPVYTAQSLRYGAAAALLAAGARLAGRRVPWPRGAEWLWLLAVAATGLALFNVALVSAVAHAEPAAVAVIVATLPLALLVGEAIRARRLPSAGLLLGAALVVLGAGIVEGGGRASATGLAWAALALACEVCFTLLAIPVLGALGALGVSLHACWIAALQLAALALLVDGDAALSLASTDQVLAIAYLAVVVTALAFVLWYRSVALIGAPLAGLLAGLMPVAAALTGMIPGITTLSPAVLGGSAIVGAGISLGLAAERAHRLRGARTVDHRRAMMRIPATGSAETTRAPVEV